jgi:hypothetical protein
MIEKLKFRISEEEIEEKYVNRIIFLISPPMIVALPVKGLHTSNQLIYT